jgi:hypothetical protein
MPRKKKPVEIPVDECSFEGCNRPAKHKRGKYVGLCAGHVNQIQRGFATADTLKPMRKPAVRENKPVLDRFFAMVEKTDTCWNWTGSLMNGYGSIAVNGRTRRAHRVAYELLVGPTDQTLVLHHKCGNRKCVNPDHLQEITYHDNAAEMLERRSYIKRIKELEAENARMRAQLKASNGGA